ncbi:MAG: hypothetical protein IJL98_06685 [Lachnospiraceae bacterium]|nr:hypothetical protein [Lachnospiraceae bacterium]
MNIVRYYTIGTFTFSLSCPEELPVPANMALFELHELAVSKEQEPYLYTVSLTKGFPLPSGSPDIIREDMAVWLRNGLETRYLWFHQHRHEGPYACVREEDSRHTAVFIDPRVTEDFLYDTVFLSVLALEKHMIGCDALILHSAYIVHENRAILFTAPAGTGKSTQAGLWEKYRGAFQVNGDRTLLQKIGGCWYARGWPVCGSSEICHNLDTSLYGIVVLSQGEKNEAVRREAGKAFQEIYPQITVNRWNRDFQLKAMDLTEALLREIPVYHLSCTISEEAVECLEKVLFP